MKHMKWNLRQWRLAALLCVAVILLAAVGLRGERTAPTPESTTRYVLALTDDGNAYRVRVS